MGARRKHSCGVGLAAWWAGSVLLLLACGEPETLAGRDAGLHPADFTESHGAYLRATGDDLTPCLSCHTPTTVGPGACNDCHTEGPQDCAVCHREPTGAHLIHQQFQCDTCHDAVGTLGASGHLEDRGDQDVRFAELATARGRAPEYAAQRCSNTACHGGEGAADPNPVWGGGRTGPVCQSCHGLPPPNHAQDRCEQCHGPVIDANRQLVPGGPHLDGQVQAVDGRTLPCDGCHGNAESPAPDTGAHTAHRTTVSSTPVACATCHVVPSEVIAPAHMDGRAEVLGAVFRGGTCSETGCHGADQPAWAGDAPCGSCHGLPPAGHPAGACDRCHLGAGPGLTIAQPSAHVDGQLDVATLGAADCASCHDARVVAGGSHGAHERFACSTCHLEPGDAVATHLDGRAPVILASGRFVEGSCADTACHGPSTPTWGGPPVSCGDCHGNPPEPHPVGACGACHPSADGPQHVDGTVDLAYSQGCDGCHGNPPADASHQAHARPHDAAPVPCAMCHVVPQNPHDFGHIDPAPAEVVLATGALAEGRCSNTTCHGGAGAADPNPAWGGPERRCGDCHGVPPPRHLRDACGTCHPAVAEGYEIRLPARHGDGQVDFR